MNRLLLATALTLMTANAALAQGITQPHCNEGSACRAAMEELQANPNQAALNANQAGPAWNLAPGSPNAATPAMCTATVGCDPAIPAPVVVENNCALSEPESFVGHPISILEGYPNLHARIFDPDHLVGTTDYWPERFNLTTDADGVIVTAGCG